ncbi:MAG: PIN domain-containing protein [Solirubrobacterales bacterium]
MTLICDAAPLVALADEDEPKREQLLELLRHEPGELVIPAQVAAEIDYLLGVRLGRSARRAFLEDLAARRYEVACLSPGDYATVARLDGHYADLELGLSDCAVIVLAARFDTTRLLTFDERDFRPVEPLQGGSFELLPADG